eukprot:9408326-Ditylum_brightwellii.AAC.1
MSPSIFLIGATNRPGLLNPSLLRPDQMCKYKFQEGVNASTVVQNMIQYMPKQLTVDDLSAIASGALSRSLKCLCNEAEEEAESLKEEKKR